MTVVAGESREVVFVAAVGAVMRLLWTGGAPNDTALAVRMADGDAADDDDDDGLWGERELCGEAEWVERVTVVVRRLSD